MKASELSLDLIKLHCGISGNDSNDLIEMYKEAAIKLASDYTGLSKEKLDEFPDITVAVLNMINEMFSQRLVMTGETQMNAFQKQILDLHSVNYL